VKGATHAILSAELPDPVSIHAPREGRDAYAIAQQKGCIRVSIHAPREGRDHTRDACPNKILHVSIHAPREGRDLKNVQQKYFN